jgi:hypothetical protein
LNTLAYKPEPRCFRRSSASANPGLTCPLSSGTETPIKVCVQIALLLHQRKDTLVVVMVVATQTVLAVVVLVEERMACHS